MNLKHQKTLYWIHPHFYNWMGGHKYIYEVIKRLQADHNFKVTLITSGLSPEARQKFEKILTPILTLSGFSTNSPIYWMFLPFFLRWENHKLQSIVKKNPNAGFISSMFPANTLASSLSKNSVQLCYEPFAFFYDQSFLSGFSLPYRLFAGWVKICYQNLDRQSVKQNKAILTLSEYNRQWIQKTYNVDSIPVYEGVDLEFFKPTTNEALVKKYQQKLVIFHSTDYTPIKGTTYLLDALPHVLKKFPQAVLIISETLPNSPNKPALLDKVQRLGLEKHVEFGGFLPYDLLPAYLSLAKVVVQPSIQQSMNLTVKEAMACQTPIITSLEGGEQTADNEAGFLVDSTDTTLLAEKIRLCLSQQKLSQRLGLKGRKIIQQKFSWDSVTQKIAIVLHSVLYA